MTTTRPARPPKVSISLEQQQALLRQELAREAMELEVMATRRWEDPEWFFRDALGAQTYDKQMEIARSVIQNRRTAVVGCNTGGKDWVTARVMLWWLNLHEQRGQPASVVVIGPTARQVEVVVFREARIAFGGARVKLAGTVYDTPYYKLSNDRFAIGFATDKPYNIQGIHSPNLLLILTEAHGIPQGHVEAAKRLTPERIVMTGNPLSASGEFYDAFHGARDQWNTIEISAYDTPNLKAAMAAIEAGESPEGRTVVPGMISWEWVEDAKRDWGVDSPLYQASVLGTFPDNLDDGLVPMSSVMAAVHRDLRSDETEQGVLGVDVAISAVGDETVIFYRRGGVCRLRWHVRGKDEMQIAAQINLLVSEDETVGTVVVDDTSVGGGVVSRLRELRAENRIRNIRIIGFKNGQRALRSEEFLNAGAEAWFAMRQAFMAGVVDIENDSKLVGELVSRKYFRHSDRKIRLQDKDEFKKAIGRSPDRADALSMTFSPLIGKLENRSALSPRERMERLRRIALPRIA